MRIQSISNDRNKTHEEYFRINADNFHFIDSLAQRGIFVGEKNLGIYTDKLAESLKLPFKTIENYARELVKKYSLPDDTYIPVVTEKGDYYDMGEAYIIMFHYGASYNLMKNYKDEAIKKGYVHPREFASLRFNYNRNIQTPDSIEPYLQPTKIYLNPSKYIKDIKALDKRREAALLPNMELDSAKHAFAHQHNLQLFFGMFNETR